MCFGNSTTSTTTNTPVANPAVSGAATSNLNFAQNLQRNGFSPYGGQQIANFSPQQLASFNMTNAIANNGTAPDAASLIGHYATAAPQSVSADTIANNMTPYMNQYVMQALAPQLTQMNIANAATNAATDAQATGSGAYGDARTGIQQANNSFLQGVQREGVIGNAYNNAFNTAIGAGAQDVSNRLAAGTTNANLAEQALNRSLGGATALQGLQNQQLGVAQAQNTMGAQQTAQQQADLTAQYNQWLMAQQYPFQTTQLLNQTVGAGANAMPATTTSTTQQPNNSGWALGGAVLGGLAGNSGLGSTLGTAALGFLSDPRMKKNKKRIGELADGTGLWSFEYLTDDVPRIGLMADEVEERVPEAVRELWPGGPKVVNYDLATAPSRMMAMAI